MSQRWNWGYRGRYGGSASAESSDRFDLYRQQEEEDAPPVHRMIAADAIRFTVVGDTETDVAGAIELWVVEPPTTTTNQAGLAAVRAALASPPPSYTRSTNATIAIQAEVAGALVVAGELWRLHHTDLPRGTTLISVPRAAVTPPASGIANYNVLPAAAKVPTVTDPVIASALRAASADSLMSSVKTLADYHTRLSTAYQATDAEIWLSSQYIRYGFEISTFEFRDNFSSNVVARLRGTKYPDQYVIAGAHYDSRARDTSDRTERAPGADDNGSGCAAVLELARVISEQKLSFEYTLILVAFSGEEQGLLGSRAYAKSLADNGAKVVAMFNSDMLGWKLPGTVPTVGMKDRYVAEWLLAAANAYTELYVPSLKVAISSSCCSDHQSFTENGFPAIGYFENQGSASDYPHYHQSTDLPEYVDPENMLLITQAMMAAAMSFAVPDLDL